MPGRVIGSPGIQCGSLHSRIGVGERGAKHCRVGRCDVAPGLQRDHAVAKVRAGEPRGRSTCEHGGVGSCEGQQCSAPERPRGVPSIHQFIERPRRDAAADVAERSGRRDPHVGVGVGEELNDLCRDGGIAECRQRGHGVDPDS